MGSRARNFVLEHRRAGGFAQAVLAYLADCMNDQTGRCYPSREKIAEYFSAPDEPCTVKRVERALARLRALGFISSVRVPYSRQTDTRKEGGWHNAYTLVGFETGVTSASDVTPKTYVTPTMERGHPQNVQWVTPNLERGHPQNGGINQKEPEVNQKEPVSSMRTSGNSSANAAVASAQAQTLPTSFSQSSNSQNHSETKTAGKDSLPNASERSVAAHRDRPDTSDEQTLQNDAGCSQNASTRISGVCPENEPPPMSDEDLENLFANAQLEECPPFPEKGVRPPFEKGEHPPFEKGVRLPDVSEKGDHLSTATKRRATTRRKPSTPCPFDMESSIPDEYLEIAKKAGIGDPQRVFSSFVAHAVANGRRLIVWPAGFRNWCDNELKWHPDQKPKITPQSQKTAKDYEWI